MFGILPLAKNWDKFLNFTVTISLKTNERTTRHTTFIIEDKYRVYQNELVHHSPTLICVFWSWIWWKFIDYLPYSFVWEEFFDRMQNETPDQTVPAMLIICHAIIQFVSMLRNEVISHHFVKCVVARCQIIPPKIVSFSFFFLFKIIHGIFIVNSKWLAFVRVIRMFEMIGNR